MDLLIVEPLEAEVMQWLGARHAVRYAPELARDPRGFRQALYNVRALIVPPSVALDAAGAALRAGAARRRPRQRRRREHRPRRLRARRRRGRAQPDSASAAAEAEFMIGALLSLLRRVPVRSADGLLVGRELGGATVGLVGMSPTARSMAQLLAGFGSRVVGYDPALHASDGVWARWQVEPLGLRELLEQSDAVCVQLDLLQPLPRPARRALPAALQAEPGAGQHRAFGPVRRSRAGRRR